MQHVRRLEKHWTPLFIAYDLDVNFEIFVDLFVFCAVVNSKQTQLNDRVLNIYLFW